MVLNPDQRVTLVSEMNDLASQVDELILEVRATDNRSLDDFTPQQLEAIQWANRSLATALSSLRSTEAHNG